MKKPMKRELVKKGIFRSVVTGGIVTGLCFAYPQLACIYFMAGYGWVLGSLEYTKHKMKRMEEWKAAPKPEKPWLRNENKPKEYLWEKVETKILHPTETIYEMSDVVKRGVETYQEYKRTKLIIKNEEKMLKLKLKMDEVEKNLENELSKN